MSEGFAKRYRQSLPSTLWFVILPLFVELFVYLIRPEVYPAYLPFFSKGINILLCFLSYGLVFAMCSLAANLLLAAFDLRPAQVIPPIFVALFSALTMARLLPFDTGFSIARILAFTTAILFGVAGFAILKKRTDPTWRFLAATCIYCGINAYMLPYLFHLPAASVFSAGLLEMLLFLLLFLVPLKITLGVGAFLLIVFFPSETPISRFARPQRVDPYKRVILVGVDGLSPEILFPMAQQGKLPACKKIIDEGIYGNLHTLDVPFSPLVWNSIYTGVEPQKHGIMAFTYSRILGAPPFLSLWLDEWTNSDWIHAATHALHRVGALQILSPAVSRSRLKPAIWNMVDQSGLKSMVIGGWTTYPPEIIHGTYISDLALIAGRNVPGTYYPQQDQLPDLLSYQPEASPWKEIDRYITKDERTHHVAMELLAHDASNAFVSVYYSSVDAFGHHYGTYIDRNSTSANDATNFRNIRGALYKRTDERIQDYLNLVDDHTLLIVCSDHGWHFDKRQHNYRVDGVLLIYGKGVRKHLEVDAGIYNIAPTITYALDIAPSAEFQDVPLRQVFDGMIRKQTPRLYHPQKDFLETGSDKNLEREKMDELKDLQYVNP